MSVPIRSANIGYPIRVFLDIPSADTLDAINALINDTNQYLGPFVSGGPNPNIDTVANLALKLTMEGMSGFATDGRKLFEIGGPGGPGAGTGVEVYFSRGSLRVKSTDNPVVT